MIKELKQKGWRVDVIHRRNRFDGDIESNGGATTVILTKHNKAIVGTAVCSESDTYCKETGRNIALARALVQIPEFRLKVPNLFL